MTRPGYMSLDVDTLAKPHWREQFQRDPILAALKMSVRRGCCTLAGLTKRLAKEARMLRWSGDRGASVVEALGKTITETRLLVHELRLMAAECGDAEAVAASRAPGTVRAGLGVRLVPDRFLTPAAAPQAGAGGV